jgi:PTS system mannitol-specific IIC component
MENTLSVQASEVKQIILACEAGMGSSLMVVNSLKKKLKKAGVTGVTLAHKPARDVPENTPLIVVHKSLSRVVRRKAPNAVIVTFDFFMNDPAFDKLIHAFVNDELILNTVI